MFKKIVWYAANWKACWLPRYSTRNPDYGIRNCREGEKIKILWILDNCTLHLPMDIELLFLPPNMTAESQPVNQGVIQSLKSRFRKYFIQQYILALENEKEFSIFILLAIRMLNKSWKCVTSAAVKNCFCQAGLCSLQMMMKKIHHYQSHWKCGTSKKLVLNKTLIYTFLWMMIWQHLKHHLIVRLLYQSQNQSMKIKRMKMKKYYYVWGCKKAG